MAGLLVAVIVGGILAVGGLLHFGSSNEKPASVSADPISLPTSLPGFEDYLTANKAALQSSSRTPTQQSELLEKQRVNNEKVSTLTRDTYQKASSGAAVAFARYADAKLERQFSVVVVRATYPTSPTVRSSTRHFSVLLLRRSALRRSARCSA